MERKMGILVGKETTEMEDLIINGVNYGNSFENVPPELMAEIANIGPMIPISFETAEAILNSDEVVIEELPFDDVVIHTKEAGDS